MHAGNEMTSWPPKPCCWGWCQADATEQDLACCRLKGCTLLAACLCQHYCCMARSNQTHRPLPWRISSRARQPRRQADIRIGSWVTYYMPHKTLAAASARECRGVTQDDNGRQRPTLWKWGHIMPIRISQEKRRQRGSNCVTHLVRRYQTL